MSRVLFIVEGQDDELSLLNAKYHGLLAEFEEEYEIVPFRTAIYELYDGYVNGDYDDLISYLVAEKGLKLAEDKIPKTAFSSVYLVFDFEPHYHKYSDEKILKLQELFCDETDMGKLFINYPTVEAFYDIESFKLKDFLYKTVSLDGFIGNRYKSDVHNKTCIKKHPITNWQRQKIIKLNFQKARLICNYDFDNGIDCLMILKEQLKKKDTNNELYILATVSLILIDCYPDKYKNLINSKQI